MQTRETTSHMYSFCVVLKSTILHEFTNRDSLKKSKIRYYTLMRKTTPCRVKNVFTDKHVGVLPRIVCVRQLFLHLCDSHIDRVSPQPVAKDVFSEVHGIADEHFRYNRVAFSHWVKEVWSDMNKQRNGTYVT